MSRTTRDDRDPYIQRLEEADRGNMRGLVELFATVQRRTFVKALGIAGQVLEERRVDQVIVSARDLLEKRRKALWAEWERAKETAALLHRRAQQRLDEVSRKLRNEIGNAFEDFAFRLDEEADGGPRGHYFRYQVVETAKKLDYFADVAEYHGWIRLVLKTPSQAEILISFHSLGREYRGLLAASVCFFRRESTSEDELQVADITPTCDAVLQINYKEQPDEAAARFEPWLQRSLVKALELWRAQL